MFSLLLFNLRQTLPFRCLFIPSLAMKKGLNTLDNPGLRKLEDLTSRLIRADVPEWYPNSDFGILFKDDSVFNTIADLAPLTLAPGLDDVLLSDQPASTDLFRTLPLPEDVLLWGAYAVLMSKPNHQCMLYLGSGTNAELGILYRTADYQPDSTKLSRFVQEAVANHYTFDHIGLLCWTPLPATGVVP
jgi:hypothetical protein